MDLEFFKIFVSEARGMIEEFLPQLLRVQEKLKQAGDVDSDTINTTFRLFHALKGSAATIGLNNIKSLSQKAEDLLDLFRSGQACCRLGHLDILIRTLNLIQSYIELVYLYKSDNGRENEKMTLEKELSDSIRLAFGVCGSDQVAKNTDGISASQSYSIRLV